MTRAWKDKKNLKVWDQEVLHRHGSCKQREYKIYQGPAHNHLGTVTLVSSRRNAKSPGTLTPGASPRMTLLSLLLRKDITLDSFVLLPEPLESLESAWLSTMSSAIYPGSSRKSILFQVLEKKLLTVSRWLVTATTSYPYLTTLTLSEDMTQKFLYNRYKVKLFRNLWLSVDHSRLAKDCKESAAAGIIW